MDYTEAEQLVGAVGTVRSPHKGPWQGKYRVVGFSHPEDDAEGVTTLMLESLETVPAKALVHPNGEPTGVVRPAHPKVVTRRTPVKWFYRDPTDGPAAA